MKKSNQLLPLILNEVQEAQSPYEEESPDIRGLKRASRCTFIKINPTNVDFVVKKPSKQLLPLFKAVPKPVEKAENNYERSILDYAYMP